MSTCKFFLLAIGSRKLLTSVPEHVQNVVTWSGRNYILVTVRHKGLLKKYEGCFTALLLNVRSCRNLSVLVACY